MTNLVLTMTTAGCFLLHMSTPGTYRIEMSTDCSNWRQVVTSWSTALYGPTMGIADTRTNQQTALYFRAERMQ